MTFTFILNKLYKKKLESLSLQGGPLLAINGVTWGPYKWPKNRWVSLGLFVSPLFQWSYFTLQQ